MKKISISKTIKNISVAEAFEDFQKFNKAKNLSARTTGYYDDCFKYFR